MGIRPASLHAPDALSHSLKPSRLHEEFRKVLADPGIRDFLTRSGIDPEGVSPEELTRYMRSELAKWAKAVKAANIKLD